MNQSNHRKFLAELGNLFIQFQIEMMQREKTVSVTNRDKVTIKNGDTIAADTKSICTIQSTAKSKG